MRRTLTLASMLFLVSTSAASDDISSLRKILNRKGYFCLAVAESWPYPGGFVLMSKKGGIATFIDLPETKDKNGKIGKNAPNASSQSVSFPADEQTKKFSLSAVLTGMEAIIGGNPGISLGHSSDLKFSQLDAQASLISYQQASGSVNSDTTQQIKDWITAGYRVFVVAVVLKTTDYSISSDGSTNVDVTFNGSAVSDCSKSDKGNQKKNDNKNNSNEPDSKEKSTPKGNSSSLREALPRVTNVSYMQQTPSQGQTTGTSKLGGTLHLCIQSNNKLTLKTKIPLVFGLGTFEVVNPDSLMSPLKPIMEVPKDGGVTNRIVLPPGTRSSGKVEMTVPDVDLATSVEPNWKHVKWSDAVAKFK